MSYINRFLVEVKQALANYRPTSVRFKQAGVVALAWMAGHHFYSTVINIFIHLRLCLATAIHNLKWVKIRYPVSSTHITW